MEKPPLCDMCKTYSELTGVQPICRRAALGDEQYERGCFEGEVLSRLATIERNQADVWTEIKNQRNEIKEINDRLEQARAEARGYIVAGKAIWAVVGALIAAVGVWFSHKGAKP